jgi:hypothetical protein
MWQTNLKNSKNCLKVISIITKDVPRGTIAKLNLTDIRGEILEILVEYLNHKYYYENLVGVHKAPEFIIPEQLALEVLIASNYLKC